MSQKKIVGYCRTSTAGQKKNGYGIDIQIKDIKRFALDNKITLDRIFKDEAVSGTKEKREELDILLELAKKGKVDAIIFPATDRTARTVRISENLYYELKSNAVRIFFVDMPYYDSNNWSDVMHRQIKQVVAESTRNDIVNRLKKGRRERVIRGKTPGGTVPYGYVRKDKKWQIKSSEKIIIKLIFELIENGENPNKICRILNDHGLKRRNDKDWIRRQVADIIKRKELYGEGIIRYGDAQGKDKNLIILKGENDQKKTNFS